MIRIVDTYELHHISYEEALELSENGRYRDDPAYVTDENARVMSSYEIRFCGVGRPNLYRCRNTRTREET